MSASLDEIPFDLYYKNGKYLRVTVQPENRKILDVLRPTLRVLTNNFGKHFSYDYYNNGVKTANLEWNFVNPDRFREEILSSDLYSNEIFYNGGLKGIPSLMAKRHKIFTPLPKEQQLTEVKLIAS